MNNTTHYRSMVETDASRIRSELERLLADRLFASARQMSAFLRYIVTETLAGNGDRIKAYSVGVDALGKPDTFDAQGDPSVRVLALRLRKTLVAIYQDTPDCHAKILLKVGTYVPEFYKRDAPVSLSTERATKQSKHSMQKVAHTEQLNIQQNRLQCCANEKSHASMVTGNASANQQRCMEDSAAALDASCHRTPGFAEIQASGQVGLLVEKLPSGGGLSDRWLYLAAAALLIAGWQIASGQADASSAESDLAPSMFSVDSEDAPGIAGELPTIHLNAMAVSEEAPIHVRRHVVTLLSDELARTGIVQVARPVSRSITAPVRRGDSQLLLSALAVGEQWKIQVEMVSYDTGVVLHADSLSVSRSAHELTRDDLVGINSLSKAILKRQQTLLEEPCLGRQQVDTGACSDSSKSTG
ncbi:MAG: hypothetical protein HKN42_13830 [Granulosicoccus sp.]|nr:hypothetical protein [Granulosicoccus sp.]